MRKTCGLRQPKPILALAIADIDDRQPLAQLRPANGQVCLETKAFLLLSPLLETCRPKENLICICGHYYADTGISVLEWHVDALEHSSLLILFQASAS